MIIAGDIGGTKCRLGLFEENDYKLTLVTSQKYPSAEFPNFEGVVERFLNDVQAQLKQKPRSACFGIPGPVVDGTVKVTNLPWALAEKDIAAKFKIPQVKLVNDLVATAAAVPQLQSDKFDLIYDGKVARTSSDGVSVVIAPGTGLGQAIISSKNGNHFFLPTESGHANFSPANEIQIELWKFMRAKLPHVSVETFICGPGIANIYRFLKEKEGMPENSALQEELKSNDWGSVITKHALNGEHEICIRTLDIFCEILGGHCSNVVLSLLATNGIYLGGGIPPKIAKLLRGESFMRGYLYKGKCREVVEKTSIRLIEDDTAALIGAGYIAKSL